MASDKKVWVKKGSFGIPLVFRIFVLLGFILIAFVFIYYTQHVAGRLKDNSLRMVNLSIKLLQVELSEEASGDATGVIFDEIIAPTEIPIIITDAGDNPLFYRNIRGLNPGEEITEEIREKLESLIQKMYRENGRFPIKHVDKTTDTETIINYFYYGDPILIYQLQAMPYIQLAIVAAFIVVGYLGYRNIKRSEQHFIWVGMAKETAHQLGTPISSLMGWLELLKMESGQGSGGNNTIDNAEISDKMTKDIERLQKIANRFSQIGSQPALSEGDLNQTISSIVDYYRDRLPYKGEGVSLKFIPGKIQNILMNTELMGWVFENLIKNSLEACDPRLGRIEISTSMTNGSTIKVTVSDNGKGILPVQQKKIFHPGYTSKKRGWGLGLSLAKRIVEQYHNGRLSLKTSIANKKTVFEVCLPANIKNK